MDETQGGNERGSRGQWMKHTGGMKGVEGAMDETQGENEGGSMKHKGGMKEAWMKHKGEMKGVGGGNG